MIRWVQRQTGKPWYPLAFFVVAFVDVWAVVLPTDGIFVASAAAQPKKWKSLAVFTAIGSALGCLSIAWLMEIAGVPFIQSNFPHFFESETWKIAEGWIHTYGMWTVFAFAVSPFSQQPAVLAAAIAEESLALIFFTVLVGRFIKYWILGVLSAEGSAALMKLPFLRRELEKLDKKLKP